MVLKSKECGKSSFIERLLLTQMAPTAQFAHLMHAGEHWAAEFSGLWTKALKELIRNPEIVQQVATRVFNQCQSQLPGEQEKTVICSPRYSNVPLKPLWGFLNSFKFKDHRIIEYSGLEGTQKDHRVQLKGKKNPFS